MHKFLSSYRGCSFNNDVQDTMQIAKGIREQHSRA